MGAVCCEQEMGHCMYHRDGFGSGRVGRQHLFIVDCSLRGVETEGHFHLVTLYSC